MVELDQSAVDDFVIELRKLLEDRDLKGLHSVVENAENRQLWAQGVWPAFDVLGPFLKGFNESGEDVIVAPKFSAALRSIVRHLTRVAKPKEALLAILEALEKFDDDGVAFGHLVDSLAPVLERLVEESGSRRKKTFVSALNAAYRHIRKLPSLQIENLEKLSELNLVDQGWEMTRTVGSLSSMIEFLSHLSPEMEKKWRTLVEKDAERLSSRLPNPFICDDVEVQAYVKQILALFDVPLSRCHSTLSSDDDKDDSSSEPSSELLARIGIGSSPGSDSSRSSHSDLKTLFQRLLKILVKFCPDLVKLLTFLRAEVTRVERARKKRQDAIDDGIEEEEEAGDKMLELTSTSGASLVHACFHESLNLEEEDASSTPPFHLPSVYSRRHILFLSAAFLPSLLLSDEELIVLKGVQTLESLTRRLESSSLDQNVLEDLSFRRVLSAVTERVLVKCPSKLIRRRALDWIKDAAPKFDAAGRFFFVRGLYYSSGHAGFKGYVLTYLLKPEIAVALKERDARDGATESDSEESDTHSFIGPNMKSWFGKIFSLPNGAETDLMQHQDTIMAALNLLRYLLIRDPLDKNWSGIWDLRSLIDKEFLAPYRQAIDLSRAHYELELSQLKSGQRDANRPEIAVDVEGGAKRSSSLPPEQEMECLETALANFDLMDSVLCRVVELIQIPNKEKDS